MKLRKITIKEASYQASDIPRKFTVVLDLDKDKDLSGLKSRTLNGVIGLSSKGHVKYTIAGRSVKKSILIMNANEVLKINKLSRIMYSTPDYFLSNEMKALYRILNKNLNYNNKKFVLQQLLEWIFQYLLEKMNKNDDFIMVVQDLSTIISIEISNLNSEINSVKDLWKSCKSVTDNIIINTKKYSQEKEHEDNINALNIISKSTYNDFKYAIQKAVENYIKNTYGHESEWTIKNEILNIPIQSKLIVFLNDDNDYNDIITTKVRQSGIDKIYNIEYINIKDWKRKTKTWVRFAGGGI